MKMDEIFISDLFNFTDELEKLGVFDAIITKDSHFFINIGRLKKTTVAQFLSSYSKINNYFSKIMLLLSSSATKEDKLYREALRKFHFSGVKGINLGFSETGVDAGFGPILSKKVISDAFDIVKSGSKQPEIFQLVGLFEENVAADRLSDMVALLSGNISESYMGVSVSRFYLELRPYVLKQKSLILIEFILLAVSVWGHIFGEYNLVIAIFMSSLMFIVIAIMEVISVFKGKRNSIVEIKAFVSWKVEKDRNYSEIIEDFCADWKAIIVVQTIEEYEEYFQLFMKMVFRTLYEEQNVQNANAYSEDIAMFLLNHSEKVANSRGIIFVNEYYRQLWLWINDNQEKAKQLKGEIRLFSRIMHELYMAIDSLEAEVVEPILEWEHLSEYVIRIASWIGFAENNSEEVNAINSLARALGIYIAKQYKKGNIVNAKRWESLIGGRLGFGAYGIPEEAIGYYRKSIAMRDFCVCYGYLLNGQAMMVRNALFVESLTNLYNVEYEEYVLMVMLIHCFMYYLGFRESLECIDENIQQEIRGVLLDTSVVNSINYFYYRIVESKNVLSSGVETQMEEILDRFELFPKHSKGKTMIIDGIVKDYFLLVSLIIEQYSFRRETLASLLDVDTYYQYLLDSNYQILRQRLFELYGIFESDKKSEEEKYKKIE